ncbi:hypothetical protein ABLB84_08135 [Xenorhabdus szentirmaii]|uniref:hypothetical protein n=1 Tax=Xenorhabdus szentirmaii TaxID=290112 RepID=UPI0032B7D697
MVIRRDKVPDARACLDGASLVDGGKSRLQPGFVADLQRGRGVNYWLRQEGILEGESLGND